MGRTPDGERHPVADTRQDRIAVMGKRDEPPGYRRSHSDPLRREVCRRTSLAVWVEGNGPPLVMVHGSLQDHTASGALVDELRNGVTTFSVDRRGFGESGDAPGYSIEREFEDVAAAVDAVADRTGGAVALWGHSYGASCAMGGAARTTDVSHLVLYEPSLGLAYPPGSIESIERKGRGGRDGGGATRGLSRHRRDDRGRGRDDAIEPEDAVDSRARDRPDRAEGVPSRGGLGLRAWPVRWRRRPDADARGFREPSRRERGDSASSGGDRRRSDPKHLRPWLELRIAMPVGPLLCVVEGRTRGRPWASDAARAQLRRVAAKAGVRRRFAPHQLRHAHAVELAHEGVPLTIIQRQLGHTNLGVTSIYLQGIDNAEIIATVHARKSPMIPASTELRL
jgi:pimeloyl-ACP methyl ester carboxylesterase